MKHVMALETEMAQWRKTEISNALVYHVLATPLTSTSWDGDSYTTATDEVLVDMVAVFGVPAGAKAVYVRYSIRGVTADNRASFGPTIGNWSMEGRTQVANIWYESCGNITLDANTKFFFQVSNTVDISIQVCGYFI